jgi:WD40 repeat protein
VHDEPTTPFQTLTNPDSTDVPSVAFSPDSGTVAAADVNGGAYLYSTATGTSINSVHPSNRQAIWAVAISPNDTLLAAGTGDRKNNNDGSVYLWAAAANNPFITSIRDPGGGSIEAVAFSPDSKTLAWSDNKGGVYLLDIANKTFTTIQALPGNSGYFINSLEFSRDGSKIAGAGENGDAYVWAVSTRQPYSKPLSGPKAHGANGVAFSPDGTMLAVADTSRRVYLWNLTSSSVITTFTSPASAAMQDVGFTPDGRTLIATASSNSTPHTSTICLWNIASHALIGAPLHDPDTDGLSQLAISPNGKILAVGDGNAHTYLWNLSWLNS